jgi:hypothetical protein
LPTIHEFLANDHVRLDALLAKAVEDPARIDEAAYREFRAGLLRHIAMEEKVLFAELKSQEIGRDLIKTLHADHAAIASILVPPPTHALIAALQGVLVEHNPLEDAPGGLYELGDQLGTADTLIARMQQIPPVRASEHLDEPRIHEHIARMLAARIPLRK